MSISIGASDIIGGLTEDVTIAGTTRQALFIQNRVVQPATGEESLSTALLLDASIAVAVQSAVTARETNYAVYRIDEEANGVLQRLHLQRRT